MNYELIEVGLVTSEPVTKFIFRDSIIRVYGLAAGWNDVNDYTRERWYQILSGTTKVLIQYPAIKQAIEPVKGDAFFVDHPAYAENSYPVYHCNFDPVYDWHHYTLYACNKITRNRTVGQLRELQTAVKRCG